MPVNFQIPCVQPQDTPSTFESPGVVSPNVVGCCCPEARWFLAQDYNLLRFACWVVGKIKNIPKWWVFMVTFTMLECLKNHREKKKHPSLLFWKRRPYWQTLGPFQKKTDLTLSGLHRLHPNSRGKSLVPVLYFTFSMKDLSRYLLPRGLGGPGGLWRLMLARICHTNGILFYPKDSMYGAFAHIYHKHPLHVGKYTHTWMVWVCVRYWVSKHQSDLASW